MTPIEVGDDVLVFGRYEGTVVKVDTLGQLLIYCPDFDDESPWLVTDLANTVLLEKKLQN